MSQKSIKSWVVFLLFFFIMYTFYVISALYATFVRRKSMYLRTCKSFKSANDKKDGSINRKFAKCHICGTAHIWWTKRDLRGALVFNLRHVLQEASKVPLHLLLRELRSPIPANFKSFDATYTKLLFTLSELR
jgi:hypothetical protein